MAGRADRFRRRLPGRPDPQAGKAWLAHCYGMLGAGRSNEEDSSIGAELYVVTGQSPRQLDRNITLVGRVLKGMELLSATPRGPAPMGFYTDPTLRTPIADPPCQRRAGSARRSRYCVPTRDLRRYGGGAAQPRG
jgi:hypothetical protein